MSLKIFSRTGNSLLPTFSLLAPASCRWTSSTPSNNSDSSSSSSINHTHQRTAFPSPTRTSWSSPGRMKALSSRQRITQRTRIMEESKNQADGRVLERFQAREWAPGDLYSPHDLSPSEMKKWMKRWSPANDAFDVLNIKPIDQYKNFSIMSEYITPMGRIKHRKVTGLRPVNQRKIAKAIRRAIGVGLMPSVHRHPEILAIEARSKYGPGSSGFA